MDSAEQPPSGEKLFLAIQWSQMAIFHLILADLARGDLFNQDENKHLPWALTSFTVIPAMMGSEKERESLYFVDDLLF
jgi:hypothetical protein